MIFSIKAEIAVLSSFINKNPIFYIKAEGEVDFALITDGKFLPIEVKWSKLVKKEEVRQILKYSNGYILYGGFEDGVIGDISIRNIERFLLEEKI